MSDKSADQRPRPKYGEYATPQEQAEIVAKSMPAVSPLLVPTDHAESVPVPTGALEPDAAPARPRRWDRFLSVGLLALGLWNVLGSFAAYTDMSGLINQVYATQDIGEYTPTSAADAVGIAIIILNVILLALAVWITVRRLMAGRLAFWVPLAAGALSIVITMVALGFVLAGDPTFLAYFTDMRGSAG